MAKQADETQVRLFHDQTESTNGYRRSHFEGWPAAQERLT